MPVKKTAMKDSCASIDKTKVQIKISLLRKLEWRDRKTEGNCPKNLICIEIVTLSSIYVTKYVWVTFLESVSVLVCPIVIDLENGI